MHARVAMIFGKLLQQRVLLLFLWHIFEQLGDDVAEFVRFALAHDVARDAARIWETTELGKC